MPDSYFSRTPKITSHGQMEALLEKRAPGVLAKVNGGSGELIEATGRIVDPNVLDSPKPSPIPAALDWLPRVEGMEAIVTSCGRYSVARARVDGVVSYQAWLRLPAPRRLGEAKPIAGEAKHIAEVHHMGDGS